MQQIDYEAGKFVYEIKGYKTRSPKGKRLSEWSHLRSEFYILGVFGTAMYPGLLFEKTFGNFGMKGSGIGIVALILAILFWDFMWSPDPSRVRHKYTITLDMQEKSLSWWRFGWRLGDPLYQKETIVLETINNSNVVEKENCWQLILFAQRGKTIYLDMPDSNSAYEIKRQLDRAQRQIARFS